MPSILALKIHFVTNLPSGEVSLPRLIEVKGHFYYHKSFLSFISGDFSLTISLLIQRSLAYIFILIKGVDTLGDIIFLFL